MAGTNKTHPARPAKKKPSRVKKQPNLKPSPKPSPLPPPQDVPQPSSPEPAPKQDLLGGIRNLFQSQSQPSQEPSSDFSNFSTSEPLSAESERILAGIPTHIGGEADDAGGPGDTAAHDDDPIAVLMSQVTFEPQDVQDQLEEFFDWLAERFESDHWKLTDRQARMLGRPTAQLLDSVWAKLCGILPDVIARWCASTPGATAFLLAAGLVVVPKVTKQIAISRSRVSPKRPVPIQGAAQPGPKKSEVPEWAPLQS